MKTTRMLAIAGLALLAGKALALADSATADTPIVPLPPGVALRVATVKLTVAPDHRDWTYKLGETVHFAVAVTADSEPLDAVVIDYTLGPEKFPGEKKTVALPPGGITIDGGTMKEPGFLRCIVTTDVGGHHYRTLATAAFAPEKIVPTEVDPADFDAFWAAGKASLAKIPMDARMTLLPDSCTSTVDVYHVSFRTGGGSGPVFQRIYGILCEPRAPGRYPAVLQVPGAGVRPYYGDSNLASKGVIVLEIGIHGIPVNLNKEVYDALFAGALKTYPSYNLDDRDHYYFHRVFMGCIRADDFLTSRPNWDGKHLVVMGGSQGGMLTIVTAALDPRVTGLAAAFPGFCDVTAELHGRAAGWPEPFAPKSDGTPSPNDTPANIATVAYYDTVNFARRVRVPGYYDWGYNDETCCPTASYAAYNVVTAPKALGVALEHNHASSIEQDDARSVWILNFLGIKADPPR